ncbi:tetratricopeptide repeat protein [Chryseobacterium herbae]|uniref:Tetratricopeptide repeat protein n=1 Tax=Chryseobacterium herbae TaxID=2976476 RepID=A0ABT2ITW1_9FLAO|nr:tetratricopeptide repeat protein [Chryseobacterium sp. pc1-10]MCT2562275.1 tetratricopeptide repeat protein [Chryseobacterium sp. pc1-10]
MITRKKFLTLGTLGVISFFFPTYLFSNSKSISGSLDVNTLLKNARNFRKQGENNQAKEIYQQIISQYPNEIRAYDGMRKTLLSQKKKEWEVILMFKGALLLNPNNVALKQRLYREYFNAALGNKKIKKVINFNGRLLSEVRQKYETFVQNHPNNSNIQKQFAKISRLMEWNADTQNSNNNTALKTYKKTQHKNFKKRFNDIPLSQLETKLNTLLSKPLSKDRKQHIRELHNVVIRKYRKDKNNITALNKALSYYNTVDKNDPLILKYIRDLTKLQKNFDTLITIETQNHTQKNSFWSALALLDAHLKKTEDQNIPVPFQLNSLIQFLEDNIDNPDKKFEFNTRKIKLDILRNQPEAAKDKIMTICKSMFGVSNTHSIDRMNVLIAKYYAKKGDAEGKNRVLSIASNPQSYAENTDPLIQSIALMNQNRASVKSVHIQNLQKLISKL